MAEYEKIDWDSKLNIYTEIFDYFEADDENYGYDPTPYIVLEKIAQSNLLKKEDVIVDYGCGKGRIEFFLNRQIGCKVIGIDHSKRLINVARNNLDSYGLCENIEFICTKAEEYLPNEANCLYFFNPFSTRIFERVLERIEESLENNPREILIFFYYSTSEYEEFLPQEKRLKLIKSIKFSEEDLKDRYPAKLDIFKFKKK